VDSLSQILLGAAAVAVCVPASRRRAALLAGAALGTLPDLDVLPLSLLSLDPVEQMTLHRGASHSLLVLPWVGLLLWWLLKRWTPVREAPRRWLFGIQLALLTHPLLDALTVYGTQLLWPLATPPVMWSSVFIIDPLYTLPLLAGCTVAWAWRARLAGQRALVLGLALSSAYLGWSLAAKALVEREVERSLADSGFEEAPHFTVPMPFQTLLWRVVVMTPNGFLEGEHSLWADQGPIAFRRYRTDTQARAQVEALPAVERLEWFNRGFMKTEVREGLVVLSDLRMGAEPDYSFNFAVAKVSEQGIEEIRPQQLAFSLQVRRRLEEMWTRIWVQPAARQGLQRGPSD
jgi:inner membrane protein